MKKSLPIAVVVILILLIIWGAFSLFSSSESGGASKTFGGLFSSSSGGSAPTEQKPSGGLIPSGEEEGVSEETGVGTPTQQPSGFFDALFGFLSGNDQGFSGIGGGSLGEGSGVGTSTPSQFTFPYSKITDVPVAGAIAVSSGTAPSSSAVVRYMERATGHIYDVDLSTMKKVRVTNTTIPRVHDATFSYKGDYVIARFLADDDQTVETFLGKVPASAGGNGALTGEFLPRDISAFSLSPDTDEIFYLLKNSDGAVGFVAPLKFPAQRKQVFVFPFTEWLAQWISKQYIVLFTKPSGLVPGYAYYVDLLQARASGEPAKVDIKIAGGINGLTALVNTIPSAAVYSDSGPSLWVYDVKNPEHKITIFQTLSEKCVWSKGNISVYCAVPEGIPSGTYPDDWYQGVVSFSDAFWKADTESGVTQYLGGPWEIVSSVDALNLFLDPSEKNLFFIDKKSMNLWRLSLETYWPFH